MASQDQPGRPGDDVPDGTYVLLPPELVFIDVDDDECTDEPVPIDDLPDGLSRALREVIDRHPD